MEENDLNLLKEHYNNSIPRIMDAIEKNKLNIENMVIPTFFKRLNFITSPIFRVSDSDFYGNIIVETQRPKTVSAIALLTIRTLVEMGYDRYSIILQIKGFAQESKDESELINSISRLVPSAILTQELEDLDFEDSKKKR